MSVGDMVQVNTAAVISVSSADLYDVRSVGGYHIPHNVYLATSVHEITVEP